MANALDQQRSERNAGLALIGAAAVAMVVANSPLAPAYDALRDLRIGPALPGKGMLSVEYWVADGLMALFFLLVGLEVKREWYDGRLSTPAERKLPFLAAAAGMAIPAAIYLAVIAGQPGLARGWAIPVATDIAFAIGVLALLGKRAPASIKLLLVTIAIIDDVGAVLIIALFYTSKLDPALLGGALAVAGAMAMLGQLGVRKLWPFMAGFALLWLLVLGSGVHATIAGVLAALTVPLARGEKRSPLKRLEHRLHPWVMFGVVPLFGLVTAGVTLDQGPGVLLEPLPLAILLGLFVGKQVGVFGAIWLAVRSGLADKPAGTRWAQIYGAALLTGIGFTMSLFIDKLAFPVDRELFDAAKVGILAGSLLSAIAGFALLRFIAPVECPADDEDEAAEIFGADQDEEKMG